MIKRYFHLCIFLALVGALLASCAPGAEQVIAGDPRGFLIQQSDLPKATSYYIPESDSFVIPNEAALQGLGLEKGGQLLKDTQRVTAARVHYQSTNPDAAAPSVYVATVVIHESAQGAKTAVEKYNTAALYPDGGWKITYDKLSLGDINVVETGDTEDQLGRRAVNVRIEFAYRNVSVDVLVFGLNKDVNISVAEKAARAILGHLQAAPLSKPPVPTPTSGAQ